MSSHLCGRETALTIVVIVECMKRRYIVLTLMLCGKYLGVASKETAKALACEGRSEKKQDPLDLAKAADGSTNRLQAMKAAFKVGMVLPLCNSSALWCLLEFSGLFD